MNIKPELKEEYEKYLEINAGDPYSKNVVDAGEVFMNLVDEGKSFDDAETDMLMTDAGIELTGFMMGALMSAVCHFHEKGTEIKKWWNKRYAPPDEEGEGVVNPALLSYTEQEENKNKDI